MSSSRSTSSAVPSQDFAALVQALQKPLQQLDVFLEEQVDAFEPEVRPLVRETLTHRGKRLRPLLVFLSGANGEESVSPELVRVAAVMELVHLATLVHDDILDNATLRHGTATLTAGYGAHQAVLLGDALFAHALRLAADFPDTEVCRCVAEATRQVCSGEIAQTFSRGHTELSLSAYRRIIDLKTAELFAASAFLGGLIAGYPRDYATAAGVFARHLGIAYQIYDDMVDLRAKEEKTGKTLGTDLASGKFTLPLLLLWQVMPVDEANALRQRCLNLTASINELDGLFELYQIDAAVMAQFDDELALAEDALLNFNHLPPYARLPKLTGFVRLAMQRLLSLPLGNC